MTTVVMTHGAFCGGWAFERFRGPFEARGWRVLAPDLRGHAPGSSARGVSMGDYVQDLEALCAGLDEAPVLLGHSMGGLVSALAARRVEPRALVLLAPSPPWGVAGSSLEEAVTALGVNLMDPFWSGVVQPDRALMKRHSLDRTPKPERDAILARMAPESARALREVLNWWLDPFMTTSLGPGPLGCPVLVISGGQDKVHPARTARATAERLGGALHVMPQMSHWLVDELGWEAVAALALDWLDGSAKAAA